MYKLILTITIYSIMNKMDLSINMLFNITNVT